MFRVVTALAPPFVMESDLDEDGLCLRGLPCHRPASSGNLYYNMYILCILFYANHSGFNVPNSKLSSS